MANYANGVLYERKLKKYLEDNNHYVIRASGSHGKADLIALPLKDSSICLPKLIQVKSHRGEKFNPGDARLILKQAEPLLKLNVTYCLKFLAFYWVFDRNRSELTLFIADKHNSKWQRCSTNILLS